jgi:hypothetical protein
VPLSQYPPLLQTRLSHRLISQFLPAKGTAQTQWPSSQLPPFKQLVFLQGLQDTPNNSKRIKAKYTRKELFFSNVYFFSKR